MFVCKFNFLPLPTVQKCLTPGVAYLHIVCDQTTGVRNIPVHCVGVTTISPRAILSPAVKIAHISVWELAASQIDYWLVYSYRHFYTLLVYNLPSLASMRCQGCELNLEIAPSRVRTRCIDQDRLRGIRCHQTFVLPLISLLLRNC